MNMERLLIELLVGIILLGVLVVIVIYCVKFALSLVIDEQPVRKVYYSKK